MIDGFFDEGGWIDKYVKVIKPSIETFRRDSDEARKILNYCDSILSDVDAVKRELTEVVFSPAMYNNLVFSHGDVHANNIMREGERLWLIDFEYSGVSFRATDLAQFIIQKQIGR